MRRRRLLASAGFLAGSLLLGALAWQLLAVLVERLRGVDFPTPGAALARLGELLAGRPYADRLIYDHVADSLGRWALGFAIAAAAGLAYGLLAGRRAWFRRLTLPLVHGLQLVPGLAWIPVVLLCFGLGPRATVAIIAVTAFPPVAIDVLAGVRSVDATWLRAARMLGAGRANLVLRVLLPGALPQVLSGLRLGLGNGWRVLLAAEMVVGSGTGLGYAIIQARWTQDHAAAFACLLIILVIGLAVERLVFASVERCTVERWHLSEEGGAR